MASMAGTIGLAGGAAYGATKAALASLTRSWAAEFSPLGVRVNAVAPGPVFSQRRWVRADRGAWPRRRCSGAAPMSTRSQSVIAFLASDKASYMTGSLIAADGGRTAI